MLLLWPSKCAVPFLIYMCAVVIQCSQVVYCGKSHEPLEFSQYTREPLGKCLFQENTSDKWDIPWYAMREQFLSILYHATENKLANTINRTYAWCTMGRLYRQIYNSFPVFWLTFLWYGINEVTKLEQNSIFLKKSLKSLEAEMQNTTS